jgi:hypothetical protein
VPPPTSSAVPLSVSDGQSSSTTIASISVRTFHPVFLVSPPDTYVFLCNTHLGEWLRYPKSEIVMRSWLMVLVSRILDTRLNRAHFNHEIEGTEQNCEVVSDDTRVQMIIVEFVPRPGRLIEAWADPGLVALFRATTVSRRSRRGHFVVLKLRSMT